MRTAFSHLLTSTPHRLCETPRVPDNLRSLFGASTGRALASVQPKGQFTLAVKAARRNIETGEYLENGQDKLLLQTDTVDGTPIGDIQTVNDNPESRDEPGTPDAAVDNDGNIAFTYSMGAGDEAAIHARLYKAQP